MERRGNRLSRRQFVVGAAGIGLVGGCGRLPWQAPPPRVARIGYLSASNAFHPYFVAFGQGMSELGYIEGQNLVIEWRFAGNQPEQLSELAVDLVRLPVELIVAVATPAIVAAQQATSTIPRGSSEASLEVVGATQVHRLHL